MELFFCLLGFLIGGHVMRLCHGHDESLTIPGADKSEEEQRLVIKLIKSFKRTTGKIVLKLINNKLKNVVTFKLHFKTEKKFFVFCLKL